jgi:type I restriction enzyme, S subunit
MSDWEVITVDSAVSLLRRGTAPVYVDESSILAIGQRCVRNGGFDKFAARPHSSAIHVAVEPQPDDVLLNSTGTGTIGRSCVFPELKGKFMVDGHVTVLRCRPEVAVGSVLNEFLRSSEGQRLLESRCFTGSTNQVELSRVQLGKLTFNMPPLEEQRRIAEILDTIDETIQATERVIAKQQLLLESLRKSLFGGARRDCSLGTFAAKIQDGTHFSPTSQSGPYRYVTSKNIRMGYLDLSTSTFISESEHRAIFSRCDPRRGDVLLTKDGANTGNVAVSDLDEEVSLLSSVAMIRCDEHGSSGRFLYHFLASERGQQQMETAMSGNAITRLTLTKIRQLRIPVAAAHEQLETAAVLDAAESSILAEKRHRLTLLQTRDGLATDLLSGRVRTVAS